MNRGTWKSSERRSSGKLGTKRTSLSGGNGKVSRSDSMSNYWFLENKAVKNEPFFSTFNKAQSYSKTLSKRFGREIIPLFIVESAEEPIAFLPFNTFAAICNGPEPSPHEPNYSDIFLSKRFYINYIYDKDYPRKTLFENTVKLAELEKKVPIVCVHVLNKVNDIAMISLEQLARHLLPIAVVEPVVVSNDK